MVTQFVERVCMKCLCWRLVCFLLVLFVFGKIYQHNQVVRLRYSVQRLDKKIQILRAEKDNCLMVQAKLSSFDAIKHWATEEAGMHEALLSHVRVLPEREVHNDQA